MTAWRARMTAPVMPAAGPAGGYALAVAAEALVGARFRLHGRDPATGLDCVGVLEVALRDAGLPCPLPSTPPFTYALKMRDVGACVRQAGAWGFAPAGGPVLPGDVLLFHLGPCQYHLVIAARGGGFVHAHAGLRRVIHAARLPEWPLEGHWRIAPHRTNES